MKTRVLILFALATGWCVTSAAVPVGWSTNLTAALENAKNSKKPVLIYFTASWCGPCKLMARTTLTNEAVVGLLTNLSRVALDIDEHSDLAQQHGVQAVPTFEMLAPAGDEIARATGFRDADQFIQWLTNSAAEVLAAVVRQEKLEERFAALDRLLQTTDPDSLRKAAHELFDLCAEKESAARKLATASLKLLAERDPSLLLDGLNHPRLATRIEVANLLRGRLGEGFEVDPWTSAATRQEALMSWREKLVPKPAAGQRSPDDRPRD